MSGDKTQLVIYQDVVETMLGAAWNAYPAEVVGLLGGVPGEVRSVWPLRNLAEAGTFWADPYEQFLATKSIEAAGDALLASFHSHPDAPAILSSLDRKYVFEVAPIAIVISLESVDRTGRFAVFEEMHGEIKEILLVKKSRN